MKSVTVPPSILNEYLTRGIEDVIPALADHLRYPWKTGMFLAEDEVIREMLEDARFNADPASMDLIPAGIRRSYQAYVYRLEHLL